jgi:hypothetical protein
MKLNEILVEREQRTDELLGGVARGAGKVLGGVAKGVGAVAGIGQGMKKAFQKGKQASIDVIGGTGQNTDGKAASAPTQSSGDNDSGAAAGGGNAGGGGGGGMAAAFNRGVNNPMGGGKAQPQQAQGGAAQTPQPQAQQAQGDAAPEEPKAEPGVVQDLQKRITALDKDSQRQVLQFLQKSAAAPAPKPEPAADNTAPPAPAANTAKPTTTPQGGTEEPAAGGNLSPDAFGKMATDLAGGAQKANDAGAKQTTQPAPQPGATEKPAATSGRPQGGGKVAGQLSTDPRAVKRREQRAAKKSIAADRERLIQPQSDSVDRSIDKMIREGFSLFRKS